MLSQVAVAGWTQAVPERRLAAVADDGTVAGLVTVVRGVGWSSHVADIRVIVDPGFRGQGVGRTLADEGLQLAWSLGMTKVTVDVPAASSGALAMLGALGFVEEARLAVRCVTGRGRCTTSSCSAGGRTKRADQARQPLTSSSSGRSNDVDHKIQLVAG